MRFLMATAETKLVCCRHALTTTWRQTASFVSSMHSSLAWTWLSWAFTARRGDDCLAPLLEQVGHHRAVTAQSLDVAVDAPR